MVTINKKGIARIFSLTRTEILYLAIIVMFGISIFFMAGLIERAANIAEKTNKNQQIALEMLNRIEEAVIKNKTK